MAMVVATVIMEPQIEGTMIRKNVWVSVAPSIRAASVSSSGTPLIAAERTTMANPTWSQIMITIMAKVLESPGACDEDHRFPSPRAWMMALSNAHLRLPGRPPGVHVAPDDGSADK